jgi:hypothetical protein
MERPLVLFNKLLEDRRIAANALESETCGIVPMAKYRAVLLIVRVLWTKKSRTNGASEVLDVVLLIYTSRELVVIGSN